MIASQNPGSTAGATYSFLDGSAVPGATYYYWMEDVDASGAATKQGPVAAKMGAARALPGLPVTVRSAPRQAPGPPAAPCPEVGLNQCLALGDGHPTAMVIDASLLPA